MLILWEFTEKSNFGGGGGLGGGESPKNGGLDS